MAQCFEITLLAGVDTSAFERFLMSDFFPKFTIFRRNVRSTGHRLLKLDDAGSAPRYVWLVFADLVGSTPETAGRGPTVLAGDLDWLDSAAEALARFGSVRRFDEVPGASA
jgi:hypothetical protein